MSRLKGLAAIAAAGLLCAAVVSYGEEGRFDRQAPRPVKLSKDGLAIIVAPMTHVYIAPGKTVLLSPLAFNKVKPAAMYLSVDTAGEQIDAGALPVTPLLPLSGLPEGAPRPLRARKTARVTIADISGNLTAVQQCIIENRDPGVRGQFTAETSDDWFLLSCKERAALGNVYCFLDRRYIGRLAPGETSARLDAHRLARGEHRLVTIAETSDGVLLPACETRLDVPDRYTLTADRTSVVVREADVNAKLMLHVTRAEGMHAPKAAISIGGVTVGEKEGGEFDFAIPLKDVPEGDVLVGVTGIGPKGERFAPELISVHVENHIWRAAIAATVEYGRIIENKAEIERLERDAAMWLERAAHEPLFYESNRITRSQFVTNIGASSYSTYSTYRTPGRSGEYIAHAREDLVVMGQLYLKNAPLYMALKMQDSGIACLRKSLQFSIANSSTYTTALTSLAAFEEAPEDD